MNQANKNFDGWNKLKKKIHVRNKEIYFYEREIWWLEIGVNVGYEQDGHKYSRPVIVVRKFNKNLFYGIPLTSKKKEGKYYFPLELNGKSNQAVLSQMRAFSSKRLMGKLGKLEVKKFLELCEAIKKSALPFSE